jgi:hypothetical protein
MESGMVVGSVSSVRVYSSQISDVIDQVLLVGGRASATCCAFAHQQRGGYEMHRVVQDPLVDGRTLRRPAEKSVTPQADQGDWNKDGG